MSQEKFRQYSSEPEQIDLNVTMTGAGNGVVPTKLFGRGVTITRVSTGLLNLTMSDYQGVFLGGAGGFSFQAKSPATVAGLAGFTVVSGALNAAGTVIPISIFNASLTLVDLQLGQVLALVLPFKAADSAI